MRMSRDQHMVRKLLRVLDRMRVGVSGAVCCDKYADRMRLYMAVERMKHD